MSLGGSMRYSARARRRGFTLVELLVSVLILGMAMVSLGQLYIASNLTAQKARYLSLATQRAGAEMEKAEDLGILSLQNGPNSASYDTASYSYNSDNKGVTFTTNEPPNGQGSVTWVNWPPNTAGNSNLLKVDVILTWHAAGIPSSQVHLTTLLTNKS